MSLQNENNALKKIVKEMEAVRFGTSMLSARWCFTAISFFEEFSRTYFDICCVRNFVECLSVMNSACTKKKCLARSLSVCGMHDSHLSKYWGFWLKFCLERIINTYTVNRNLHLLPWRVSKSEAQSSIVKTYQFRLIYFAVYDNNETRVLV